MCSQLADPPTCSSRLPRTFESATRTSSSSSSSSRMYGKSSFRVLSGPKAMQIVAKLLTAFIRFF